jgi:Concanavalin A-like lectin/glucanases superfamily
MSGIISCQGGMNAANSVKNGLLAHWKINEGSGSSVLDYSGNGYTATVYGTPGWTTDVVGNALQFDGSTNYISSGLQLSTAQAKSFSAWVWLDPSAVSAVPVIMGLLASGGPITVWAHDLTYNHALNAQVGNYLNTLLQTNNSTTFSGGVLAHVGFSWDGASTASIIVNGAVISTTTGSATTSSTPYTVQIGSNISGNNFWMGRIHDVRVYNRALTANEWLKLFSEHRGLL